MSGKKKTPGTITIDEDGTYSITDESGNDIEIVSSVSGVGSSGMITASTPYPPVYHDWQTTTAIDFGESYPHTEKCSKCKKEGPVYEKYNWSKEPKLDRVICQKCHARIMDKLYGLDNNIAAEEALYDKPEKK